MKKKFILIVASLLVPAVILSVPAKENHQKKHQIHNSEKKLKLKLNNGKKWKADQVARQGFSNMSLLLKPGSGKVLSVKEYQALGTSFLHETDNILNKCTMKGQGHEELHKLLLQVIEELRVLKGNDLAQSKKAINRLKINLVNFTNYFE